MCKKTGYIDGWGPIWQDQKKRDKYGAFHQNATVPNKPAEGVPSAHIAPTYGEPKLLLEMIAGYR